MGDVVDLHPLTTPITLTAAPFTQEQLDTHTTTILELTKLAEFQRDTDRQAQAFESMQVLWPQLPDPHRRNIKARVVEALSIPEGRFDYLIATDDRVDLRLALDWVRPPFARQKDESVYPDATDGWLGRYLHYAEVGKAHVGWHHWCGLITLAAACRRNFFINVGHKPMYPNLYILLEGPSGSGKNTAIERARQLLAQMNIKLTLQNEGSLENCAAISLPPARLTLRSLFNCLQLNGDGRRRVGPMRMVQSVGDYETASCVISPEASYLIGKENFDSANLIVAFTNAYDGWMEDGTGMHGVIRINNLVLSLLLGSTMSWLRENITPEVFQGGFMGARTLVITKQKTLRRYPWEPIVDPIQRASLVDQLCQYATHNPVSMHLTKEANQRYEEWFHGFQEQSPSTDDRISGYFERKSVYIPKLALLYAASRGHIPYIQDSDMRSAIELLEWEEPAMLACFRQMVSPTESSHAEWVLSLVDKVGGQCKKSELARMASSRLTGFVLREIITNLINQGFLAWRTESSERTKGPKATIYYRPTVWDEKGELLHKTQGEQLP